MRTMLRYCFLLSLSLPLTLSAPAQTVGSCAVGNASAVLGVNGVRAGLFNRGNLAWQDDTPLNDGAPLYEVPKGSGIQSMLTSTLWTGGLVGGELRMSASSYGQFGEEYELYPGPLGPDGTPPADCEPFDRIWRVSRFDLADYERTGVASADLAEWPAALGAPYFDVDGDGRYDLAAGDRPAISGDEMAWWVMNDVAGPHRKTLSDPIGLEVRASAFGKASPDSALRYTTFYRYDLTYRGSTPLDSAYFGVHTDALGDGFYKFAGTDSLRNLAFVYEANNDAGGNGIASPALGLRILDGPVLLSNGQDDDYDGLIDEAGERGLMTAGSWVTDNHPYGYDGPNPAQQFYNLLRCRWGDGARWKVGGDGYCNSEGCGPENPAEQTCWVFPNSGTPADPVPGYWSEMCLDPDCERSNANDGYGRFHVSTGPFALQPGETTTVTLAFVWARGQNNFDSVQELKVASDFVERAYRLGVLDPVAPPLAEAEPLPSAYGLSQPFPNPFRESAELTLTVPEEASPLRLAVYDVLGREVAVLADGVLAPGEHLLTLGGAGLPSGLYVLRLSAERQSRSLTVLHVE